MTVAYIRTHKGCNDAEQQHAAIEAWAAANGVQVDAIFRDGPGRALPARAAMLRSVEAGSAVLLASAHRLAPTLPALLRMLVALRAQGVCVRVADSDPRAAVAFDALLAGLPALEAARAGIRGDAVAAGRARARARGVRFGRPPVDPQKVERVRQALAAGLGVRGAARVAGVGVATAHRVKKGEYGSGQSSPP